jgi:predicted RNA binding protein YcfA (HicA-like mRNA interferase family)
MSNLPALTSKDLIKILEQKGFVLKRTKGSHHFYVHPKTGHIAVVPMHKKDLPKGTLMAIIKQAGINKSELQ